MSEADQKADEQRILDAGYLPLVPHELWIGPGGVMDTEQAIKLLDGEKGEGKKP